MNNLLKKSILIISLGLYAVGVGAESRWVSIGIAEVERTQVAIDTNSVKKIGNKTSAWIKFIELNNSYILHHSIYECSAEKSSLTDSVSYSAAGALIESWSGTYQPKPIVPGSVGSMIFEFLCR